MVKLDVKDKKILSALDMDARMPITQLAKKVRLSRQLVEYRIKRLKKEKVIFGSKAIFDSVTAGFKWYRVAFRLLNITKQEKNDLINHLKSHKYVFWLGEVGGNWDLVVNFTCKDNFQFNKIFEKVITDYGKYIRDYEILIYVNVTDLERSYIFKKQERKEFYHQMKLDQIKLDKLDKYIIRELSINADVTNVELANKYKVAANTIKNRINEMKNNKLLLGFRLFINPAVFGYQSHMLFLEINRLDLKKERKLVEYLKTIPNITFIVKHIGKWRIGMEIETKNEKEFQEIFVKIRGEFSDIITNFESFPLFKDHVINYYPEGILE
jgi:DNA-binding Lrp family transcriptional regulator